jgi:6-phosphogluconolactonase (cycloisomerase 2 family)
VTLLALSLVMVACGGHDNNASYSVGVTVSGLAGSGLLLENNGANDLTVAANGTYSLGMLQNNSSYNVTVKTQPANPVQTCTAANPSGTVHGNVTIAITCTTNSYAVGGAVTGLTGSGLVITNGSESMPIAASGTFAFSTKVAAGQRYGVAIASQPTGTPAQNCTFRNGSGAGAVASADVTTIQIACVNVGRFLYISSYGDNAVIGYSIDPASGALTPLAGGPFPTGASPGPILFSPDEKFAYVLNLTDRSVSMFSIDGATGNWTALAGGPLVVGSPAVLPFQGIAIHPSGKFAYVATEIVSGRDTPGITIAVYNINTATGAWTAASGAPMTLDGSVPSDNVLALAFDPTGQFAYTTGNQAINVYAVDPTTGFFTSVTTTAVDPFENPDLIAVRPDGKFLYATGNRSALSEYSLAGGTGLTELQGSPFNNGGSSEPTLVALDPGGNFLYTSDCDCRVGWDAPGLLFGSVLDGTTGKASSIVPSNSPTDVLVQVGINPSRLVFEPSGKFAYISSTSGQTCAGPGVAPAPGATEPPQIVSGFAVDASSGGLTPFTGNPFTVGSLATDCTARSPVTLQ